MPDSDQSPHALRLDAGTKLHANFQNSNDLGGAKGAIKQSLLFELHVPVRAGTEKKRTECKDSEQLP
jgi:hypothetical protein